jgi:hypothetical protein
LASGIPVIVYESPMIFWDDDHPNNQLRILRQFDTGYFRYLSEVHGLNLQEQTRAHAGIALRTAYSHAAETLFALTCAALQAPHYPIGWLLKYRYEEMRQILMKVNEGESFQNLLRFEDGGWNEVANLLIPWQDAGIDFDELRNAAATLWTSVAQDVLDEAFDHEYMSLKHGLRGVSGPWNFSLSTVPQHGTDPSAEEVIISSSSQFGSSYYHLVNLKKYNWMVKETRVNWNPGKLAKTLFVMSLSIDLVVMFLRVVSGDDPRDIEFPYFNQSQVREALHDAHEFHSGVRATRTPGIKVEYTSPYYNKSDEILEAYENLKRQLYGNDESKAGDYSNGGN